MNDLAEKLPKKVKVGAYTYALQRVPNDNTELEGNYGMTLLEAGRVLFAADIPFERLVNTVLHEIGHCINHNYGVEDRAKEEQIATQSANGWQQVYLDNPKLEMWLHKSYRELRKTR
jgi:hypothetical protein